MNKSFHIISVSILKIQTPVLCKSLIEIPSSNIRKITHCISAVTFLSWAVTVSMPHFHWPFLNLFMDFFTIFACSFCQYIHEVFVSTFINLLSVHSSTFCQYIHQPFVITFMNTFSVCSWTLSQDISLNRGRVDWSPCLLGISDKLLLSGNDWKQFQIFSIIHLLCEVDRPLMHCIFLTRRGLRHFIFGNVNDGHMKRWFQV